MVTRPVNQNNHLDTLISAAGGHSIVFPTIEIQETRDRKSLEAVIDKLESYSIAIFISPNSASYAIQEIHKRKKDFSADTLLACIGKGSADVLNALGYRDNVITPVELYNSEALLKLAELQNVDKKNIVIFRGNGGRNVLKQSLTTRGATVDYGECYQRVIPNCDNRPLLKAIADNEIDVITITSSAALHNLLKMVDADTAALIREIPLVVVSRRIAAVGKQLGFKHPAMVTANASDQAIVETIKQWQTSEKNAL